MPKIILMPETTRKPLTLIGERAGVCWGANIRSPEANYKRGMDCLASNHGRTLEFVNVEAVFDGYSARVIREWYTHIGGAPTRLQASTRYIDYSNFSYVTPKSIVNNEEALKVYEAYIKNTRDTLQNLVSLGVPREDAALALPLGMTTRIVDKRNLRNLIDMSRQRMCSRAYWEFRELFADLCKELKAYSDEWAFIIDHYMMPKCEALGYCPEKRGCGRYKPKEGE